MNICRHMPPADIIHFLINHLSLPSKGYTTNVGPKTLRSPHIKVGNSCPWGYHRGQELPLLLSTRVVVVGGGGGIVKRSATFASPEICLKRFFWSSDGGQRDTAVFLEVAETWGHPFPGALHGGRTVRAQRYRHKAAENLLEGIKQCEAVGPRHRYERNLGRGHGCATLTVSRPCDGSATAHRPDDKDYRPRRAHGRGRASPVVNVHHGHELQSGGGEHPLDEGHVTCRLEVAEDPFDHPIGGAAPPRHEPRD